jgi:hypothetical protein
MYKMEKMDTNRTNDVVDLVKFGLTTFLNIGEMGRYMYLYFSEKESQNNIRTSARALNQNRDKMIYHTCLAGVGILGLFTIGIVGLTESRRNY